MGVLYPIARLAPPQKALENLIRDTLPAQAAREQGCVLATIFKRAISAEYNLSGIDADIKGGEEFHVFFGKLKDGHIEFPDCVLAYSRKLLEGHVCATCDAPFEGAPRFVKDALNGEPLTFCSAPCFFAFKNQHDAGGNGDKASELTANSGVSPEETQNPAVPLATILEAATPRLRNVVSGTLRAELQGGRDD